MSRQIQIRRGTSEEHANFTGAIGEVTMDTTAKTLRVHDGETAGGTPLAKQSALDAADYVVESQLPTAENSYTWYRKYKSGWVEQGGILYYQNTADRWTIANVVFPIVMKDKYYTAVATAYGLDNVSTILVNIGGINQSNADNNTGKTKTGMSIQTEALYAGSVARERRVQWQVSGIAEV